MKILNLYAGIGGNRKLWGGEHTITAVELNPEIASIYGDFYPDDTLVIGDAHQYLLENYMDFDFIWSSPPCPTHSKMRYMLGVGSGKVPYTYPEMSLYQEKIFLDSQALRTGWKGRYCIENVEAYYQPLLKPMAFGRHWFWVNFAMPPLESKTRLTSYKKENGDVRHLDNESGIRSESMGIDLSQFGLTKQKETLLLRNCVEPELGKHILDWAQKDYSPTKSLFEVAPIN